MHLDVPAVAELFSVSEKIVYRWINQNSLPAYQIHDQYRFNSTELVEWAIANNITFSPELIEAGEGQSGRTSLANALLAGGIYPSIPGTTRETVLQELVKTIKPLPISAEFLYSILLARENLGTTAIGDGIAIPHARMPVVLHVEDPAVSLCFLEQPVEFGALDRKPVHTLFTIISPTIRVHLHLLALLSHALRSEQFRKVLHKDTPAETIIAQIRLLESAIPDRSF